MHEGIGGSREVLGEAWRFRRQQGAIGGCMKV